jgi:hypothetical protein
MDGLFTCDVRTGKCRPATDDERLEWDRREYLRILTSNPDRPELQHLFPERLQKREAIEECDQYRLTAQGGTMACPACGYPDNPGSAGCGVCDSHPEVLGGKGVEKALSLLAAYLDGHKGKDDEWMLQYAYALLMRENGDDILNADEWRRLEERFVPGWTESELPKVRRHR